MEKMASILRFVPRYSPVETAMKDALSSWCSTVTSGAFTHAGHVEFPRGPVGLARVVREVCFGDLDPCFGQFEGLLSPVYLHDGPQVRGDQGKKAGSHDTDDHDHDDREP